MSLSILAFDLGIKGELRCRWSYFDFAIIGVADYNMEKRGRVKEYQSLVQTPASRAAILNT